MILSADWGIFMRSGEQHYASIDLSDPTSWEKIIIRIIKMPWIRRCSFDVVLDLFCICGVVLYFAADKSNGETRESSKSLIPSFFCTVYYESKYFLLQSPESNDEMLIFTAFRRKGSWHETTVASCSPYQIAFSASVPVYRDCKGGKKHWTIIQ